MHALRLLTCVLAIAGANTGCHVGLLGVLGSDSGSVYRAGTLGQELGGASVRTIGCLDVGLALVDRPNLGASFVQLNIGNRCNHAEALDFARVRIDGVLPDGEHRVVTLEDPRHEIVELHVGAGEHGRELVRLNTAVDLLRLSFDVTDIAADAPHAHPARLTFIRENTTAPWTAFL